MVHEGKETEVDQPVDQLKAETVEEEEEAEEEENHSVAGKMQV